jgi:hypothetical protein
MLEAISLSQPQPKVPPELLRFLGKVRLGGGARGWAREDGISPPTSQPAKQPVPAHGLPASPVCRISLPASHPHLPSAPPDLLRVAARRAPPRVPHHHLPRRDALLRRAGGDVQAGGSGAEGGRAKGRAGGLVVGGLRLWVAGLCALAEMYKLVGGYPCETPVGTRGASSWLLGRWVAGREGQGAGHPSTSLLPTGLGVPARPTPPPPPPSCTRRTPSTAPGASAARSPRRGSRCRSRSTGSGWRRRACSASSTRPPPAARSWCAPGAFGGWLRDFGALRRRSWAWAVGGRPRPAGGSRHTHARPPRRRRLPHPSPALARRGRAVGGAVGGVRKAAQPVGRARGVRSLC